MHVSIKRYDYELRYDYEYVYMSKSSLCTSYLLKAEVWHENLTQVIYSLLGFCAAWFLQRLRYIAETSGAFVTVYAVRIEPYKCSYIHTYLLIYCDL